MSLLCIQQHPLNLSLHIMLGAVLEYLWGGGGGGFSFWLSCLKGKLAALHVI